MPLLVFAALAILPAQAISQYLYLDANGDGIHDGSDVVQPDVPTVVDVWLRTDANRDGSAAVCPSEDGALSLSSYEFILRASNGTISWGVVSNLVANFTAGVPPTHTSTELHAAYGGAGLPPGLYRLATLSLSVETGTPSIDVVPYPNSLPGALETAFGSACSGVDYDNTLALGVEWFDADGLAFGGSVRHPPILDSIPTLTVSENEIQDQPVYATDEDGDPLTFGKDEGPSFMEVATVDPGNGRAEGRIRLSPGFADAGLDTGEVSVTDGDRTARARFRIDVRNTNRAPVLRFPIPNLQLAAGTQLLQGMSGYDPDGTPVYFYKAAGPEYMAVGDLFPGVGAGYISLAPSLSQAGDTTGVVGLTDGLSSTTQSFGIRVTIAPVFEPVADMTARVNEVARQELHASSGDGDPVTFEMVRGPHFMRVSTTDPGTGMASGMVFLTPSTFDAGQYEAAVRAWDGTDEDVATFRIAVVDPNGPPTTALFDGAFLSSTVPNGPTNLAVLDGNADGKLDVVATSRGLDWPHVIDVLSGAGDGTFDLTQRIDIEETPTSVASVDFDRDGNPDVAICTNEGTLYLFQGSPEGSFREAARLSGGQSSHSILVGDWDRDQWPDLAVLSHFEGISIFRNHGDGTYEEPARYGAGLTPVGIAHGDFDEDGDEDFVFSDFRSNALGFYWNRGDGSLERGADQSTGNGPAGILVGDLTGDGHLDVVVTNNYDATTWAFAGTGDGSFAAPYVIEGVPGISRFEDFNSDGTLDAVAPNGSEGTLRVWLGLGGGRFGPARVLRTGRHPTDVVVADLNSDGRPDLIAPDDEGKQVCVHLGGPGGEFVAPVTIATGNSTAQGLSGDWNEDGRDDLALIVANPGRVSLFLGDSVGMLRPGAEFPAGAAPGCIVSGDIDADGRADLLVSDREEHQIRWYRNAGGGSFDPPAAIPVPSALERMALGDFDRDGHLDLAVSVSVGALGDGLLVLRGRGDGTFLDAVGYDPFTRSTWPVIGDFDGDGNQDVVYLNRWYAGIGTLWGNGDGTFQTDAGRGTLSLPGGALAADLDRAGGSDLLVSFPDSNAVVLYRADPSRTWTEGDRYETGVGGADLALRDLNGDGASDLAVSNRGSFTVSFLPGNSDGSFGQRIDFGTGVYTNSLMAGDVNGDGRPDLVSLNAQGVLVILRNLGVLPVDHPPLAEAGGPYQGTAGVPLEFQGATSSDPDGDALRYEWSFGDGATALGPTPLHAYVHGGEYVARLVVDDGVKQGADSAAVSISDFLGARAFRRSSSVVVIGAGARTLPVAIEPAGGFSIDQMTPGAIWLSWAGPSSTDSIPAMSSKDLVVSDVDHNGTLEAQASFSRDDLARLFDTVVGRQAVNVSISGKLTTGGRFRASLTLPIVSNPSGINASLFPNPLNPRAVLSFSIRRPGIVRIDLFDASGRRVRELLPAQFLDSGSHEIEVDGRDRSGHPLPSGVYFYRIESGGRTQSNHFVILK